MKKLIPKYQEGKTFRWQRVHLPKSQKYGYVKIGMNDTRPIEFNTNTGQFLVYVDNPNSKQKFWTSLEKNLNQSRKLPPAPDYSTFTDNIHSSNHVREDVQRNEDISNENIYNNAYRSSDNNTLRNLWLALLQGSAHRVWYDNQGQRHEEFGEQGMSGADPLGKFYIEGTALGKPLELATLWGLGRYGSGSLQNWARSKIISDEMNSSLMSHTSPTFSPSTFTSLKADGSINPSASLKELPVEEQIDKISKVGLYRSTRVPEEIILKTTPVERDVARYFFKDSGFWPSFQISPRFAANYGNEIARRLIDLGVSPKYTFTSKVFPDIMNQDLFLATRSLINKPVWFGTYLKNNRWWGHYSGKTGDVGIDVAKTGKVGNTGSVIIHERGMHGTDDLIHQLGFSSMYNSYLKALFGKFKVKPSTDGRTWILLNGDSSFAITPDSLNWWEFRATLGELINRYYGRLGGRDALKNMPLWRNRFNLYVDNISDEELITDLSRINGYGNTYSQLLKNISGNNKVFMRGLRNLLKNAPAISVPVTITSQQSK